MADIASELASKCGISVDAARKGLGIILSLLKSKLPAESFAKVSSAIPDAESLMPGDSEHSEQESAGLIGAVKGAIGKIIGGGATDALISKFGQLGMSADQVEGFLPKVLESFEGKVPENVMSQISGLLPTPHVSAH